MKNKIKILLPYLLIILGLFFAKKYNIDMSFFIHNIYFQLLINTILAIGLYSAVYGINIEEFKNNKQLIFNVITIGVLFKIIFVGSIMYYFTNNLLSFLIATALAQIDPISVTTLQSSKSKLSKQGKTILHAWASFDDPVTVVFAVVMSSYILTYNIDNFSIVYEEFYNIIFAGVIYGLYKLFSKYKNIEYILLFISFFIAIYYELFLAIALIGLFLRPKIIFLENLMNILFLLVSFITGLILAKSINFQIGIFFGILVIISQIITTFILARKLNKKDKYRLAFAQQSGITAITLSLFLATKHNDIINNVIVAVLTINILYIILNYILEYICLKKK